MPKKKIRSLGGLNPENRIKDVEVVALYRSSTPTKFGIFHFDPEGVPQARRRPVREDVADLLVREGKVRYADEADAPEQVVEDGEVNLRGEPVLTSDAGTLKADSETTLGAAEPADEVDADDAPPLDEQPAAAPRRGGRPPKAS